MRDQLKNVIISLFPSIPLSSLIILMIFYQIDSRPLFPLLVIVLVFPILKDSILSLLIGLLIGAALNSRNLVDTSLLVFSVLMSTLSSPSNIGIFLVILLIGSLAFLMKEGGEAMAYLLGTKAGKFLELLIFITGLSTYLSQYYSYPIIGMFKDISKKIGFPRAKLACYVNFMSILPTPLLLASTWGIFVTILIPSNYVDNIIFRFMGIDIFLYCFLPISAIFTFAFMLMFEIWHGTGWPKMDLLMQVNQTSQSPTKGMIAGENYCDNLMTKFEVIFLSIFIFIFPLMLAIVLPIWLNVSSIIILNALVAVSFIAAYSFLFLLAYIIVNSLREKEEPIEGGLGMLETVQEALFYVWNEKVLAGVHKILNLLIMLILIFCLRNLTVNNLALGTSLNRLIMMLQTQPIALWILVSSLPLLCFLFSCGFSFSIGSAFLTMGILIPPFSQISISLNMISELPWIVGAIISGATFGNCCSRLADSIFFVNRDYYDKSKTVAFTIFHTLNDSICIFLLVINSFIYALSGLWKFGMLEGILVSIVLTLFSPRIIAWLFQWLSRIRKLNRLTLITEGWIEL